MTITEQPSYLAILIADYRQAKAWFAQHVGMLPTMVVAAVAVELVETEQALRTTYAPTTSISETQTTADLA